LEREEIIIFLVLLKIMEQRKERKEYLYEGITCQREKRKNLKKFFDEMQNNNYFFWCEVMKGE